MGRVKHNPRPDAPLSTGRVSMTQWPCAPERWSLWSGWREKSFKMQPEKTFGWWKELRRQWGKWWHLAPLPKAATRVLWFVSEFLNTQIGLQVAEKQDWGTLGMGSWIVWNQGIRRKWFICWNCTGEHIPLTFKHWNHSPPTWPQIWPHGKRGLPALFHFMN